jgi:hypothetical protein
MSAARRWYPGGRGRVRVPACLPASHDQPAQPAASASQQDQQPETTTAAQQDIRGCTALVRQWSIKPGCGLQPGGAPSIVLNQ